MSAKEILQSIVNDFDISRFEQFFRQKNDKLNFPYEDLSVGNLDNFSDGKKIAKAQLEDGDLIVCSILVKKELTERSGKKSQYEIGKQILKQHQADAGIFIFYDSKGDFRFSLIYTNYLGKRRDWSTFKRFTYFVSKNQTNKTFLKQIGDGDLSSIKKTKEAFSVEKVTKEFYDEIQSWYFWTMDKIKFPEDYQYSKDVVKDKEIRNATNLIRLITRIIFIWFLKEKNLVSADLFSKEKLEKTIRDFMKDKKASNFYNAILQNLFFATLNQKMNERKFTENKGYPANKKEYGVKNLYRYEDKFLISKNEVLKIFENIPFLNGGLFDCLDKEDETGKVVYIDGFSRNPAKQAIIPDYLFFKEDEEAVDLSKYGLGKKQVRGLIEILNNYNFTIDENTPLDQEIALDPELLGKVFENLLASYNPETATTARKATGSYYTPREIVDYMVETSLFEYLKEKFPEIGEEKIKTLLSYSEEIPEFSEEEKQKIITEIDKIKILDPACGSGAFPMGILHKLVFVLQKIDSKNKYWRELQHQKALEEFKKVFKQNNKNQREELLKEINETFDEGIHYPDYARKLYLIENCIYGVDIQPIAIQISKLRFFISLVLDQKVDRKKENLGIRALPNLETRFVSANTLICLDKPDGILFYTPEIKNIEEEIKQLRHKYFFAKSRSEKRSYQERDRELRKKLQDALKKIGYTTDSSKKIANFDPYDQNASVDWFEPEWMFGVKDGFDIVIANPPYIKQERIKDQKPILKKQNYEVFNSTSDIYTYFYEKGYQLLKPEGILCFISSNKWLRAKYGEKLRKFLKEKTTIKQIIDFNGYKVFEATVDTNIILFQKTKPSNNIIYVLSIQPDFTPSTNITDYFKEHKLQIKQSDLDINCFTFGDKSVLNLKKKIEQIGTPLKNWDVKIYYGIKTGLNEAFIIDSAKREEILNNCQDDDERERTKAIIKPILRGRDIYRYGYKWAGLWVIIVKYGFHTEIEKNYPAVLNHLTKYKNFLQNRGQCRYSRGGKNNIGQHHWLELDNNPRDNYLNEFEKEKIVWQEIVRESSFTYDKNNFYCEATTFLMTGKNLKYLIAVLNSKPATFLFKQFYAGGGLGESGYRYKKAFLEQLPIPKISELEQQPFINLVDKILAITKDEDYLENPEKQAKVKEYENQIDELVYKLYNLTDEEIKIIEENE
ncbi:MAG: Eco57I restriction-modification methylase domain-containing protein [Candidatus Pacebacteria bacterium]|nr:Eco57I restriction-modification methylase domain-containing protein [Candidatus Paceibacterota bacterium]